MDVAQYERVGAALARYQHPVTVHHIGVAAHAARAAHNLVLAQPQPNLSVAEIEKINAFQRWVSTFERRRRVKTRFE